MAKVRVKIVSFAALAASMGSLPAMAQTTSSTTQDEQPAPTSDSRGIAPVPSVAASQADHSVGEIVVTAQKRTERLIDVPVAVSVVTGERLASQQINDSQSLTRAVPALTYQQGGAPNNSSFRIRGVGTSLFGQGVEPSVSVVVDGVVAPRASSGFADLLDIERVEVLRGPQGTLFGKNATAGVINIVTARPANEFGGHVEATIAERQEYRVKGTLTGSIAEGLRGRLSGYYNNVGGHLYNIKTDSYQGGFESWGLRGKLEWDPTSSLNFLLSAEVREYDANCCDTPFVRVDNPVLAQILRPLVVTSSDNHMNNNDNLSYVKTDLTQISLQADWDIGPATITSITAFQGYQERNQLEQDQIVSDPTRFVGAAAFASWNFQPAHQKQKSYTEEVRIASNGGGDLTYVAGIFLSKLDLHRNLVRRRQTCSAGVVGQPCTGTIVNQSGGFDAQFDSESASIFGQADYRIWGGLHVLGGLRGQYEKQRVEGSQFGPLMTGDVLFPGTTVNEGISERDGTAVTGKAGLRYEVDRNLQTYFSYTRGYKAFALDLGATTIFTNNSGLNPEHVDAYELGAKWRHASGVFDLNAALFRSDYTDLQTQTVISDPVTGVFTVQQINAGKSRTQGFEIESTMRPSDSLSIGMSFSYTDATIDVDGLQCALQQQAAAPILTANFPVNSCYRRRITTNGVVTTSPPIVDVRGGQLPVAPKYRVSIQPRYEAEFGSTFRAFAQASINFQSSSLFAVNQDPLLKQKSYTIVDLTAGFSDPGERYTVSVFVRNLFNTNYYTGLAHAAILQSTTQPFDLQASYAKDSQRYAGATLSLRF